jgi:hypothetical protein
LRSVSCSQSSCLQEDSKEHRKEKKKKNFFRSNSTCALQTLDEEKSKHVDLGQQNGFGPTFFAQDAEAGKMNGKDQRPTHAAFDLLDGFDWCRWVAISTLPPYAVPILCARFGKNK